MIIPSGGTPVKNSNQLLYTAPTEKYFPRDNDFTDHVAPTLTGAEAKLYDEMVRLCTRTTGYCAYNERQLACKAKLGYSTVRAAVPVLEACGLVAKRPQRKYFGVDTMGREQWHDEGNHFQVLAKECWRIFPKAPRKPRNGPRPEVDSKDLAPHSLAEIKQESAKNKLESAYFQQESAKNKRTKQNLSFKTSSQDKQQHRVRAKSQPAPVVVAAEAVPVVVEVAKAHNDTDRDVCEQSEPQVLAVEPGNSQLISNAPGIGNSNPNLMAQLLALGVKPAVAHQLVQSHAATLPLQLACLEDREPRNAAATLIQATREGWTPPAKYLQRLEAQERDAREKEAQVLAAQKATQQRAAEAQKRDAGAAEEEELDAAFEAMSEAERAPIVAQLTAHFAKMPAFMQRPSALAAQRRLLQRGVAPATPSAQPGLLFQ